jgi:N-acetylglutamate synthase-like GNAT family acetyltransferase
MGASPVYLRAAVAADQQTIRKMIRAAHLNPMRLHWSAFIVAVEAASGRIVGVGQVRPHRDGGRELASIAVTPQRQGQGIGGAIIQALLAREQGELHLYTRCGLTGYYERFGFVVIPGEQLPASMRLGYRIGATMMGAARLLGLMDERLCAMLRRA